MKRPGWNGQPIIKMVNPATYEVRNTDPTAWGQLICDAISPGRWIFEQTGGWDSRDGGPCAYPYSWARTRGWRFMAKYGKRPAGGHFCLIVPEQNAYWNPDPDLNVDPHPDYRVFNMQEVR